MGLSPDDNYSLDLGRPPRTVDEPAFVDRVLHFLALASVPGLGRVSLGAILGRYPSLSDVWDAPGYELERLLRLRKNRAAATVVERIFTDRSKLIDRAEGLLESFERARISVIFRDSVAYPVKLKNAGGPQWLFVQGSVDLLSRRAAVAIVGTRTPSLEGIGNARDLASLLAESGFSIISGLADGIDAEVHTAVVDCAGETVAVLGNGLNVEFPAGSNDLRRRILQASGTIVTEYLWNERYSRSTFVERNRIQAGLSGAVIPVECRAKSGTAHTIRFASEMGRPIAGIRSRTLPQPGDEVFDLLSKLSAPIFDIGTSAGIERLREFLAPIAIDLRPPSADRPTQRRKIYAPALRQLREIIARRKPSEEERSWLLEAMRRLLSHSQEME